MIKSKEILSLLDDEFSELNRPIFEWRESNYVGSKCTLLRLNDDNWLLAIHCFEVDSKGPFWLFIPIVTVFRQLQIDNN